MDRGRSLGQDSSPLDGNSKRSRSPSEERQDKSQLEAVRSKSKRRYYSDEELGRLMKPKHKPNQDRPQYSNSIILQLDGANEEDDYEGESSSGVKRMPNSPQPAKLENYWNNCYLNSLLQFMMTLTEFNDQLKMDLTEYDIDETVLVKHYMKFIKDYDEKGRGGDSGQMTGNLEAFKIAIEDKLFKPGPTSREFGMPFRDMQRDPLDVFLAIFSELHYVNPPTLYQFRLFYRDYYSCFSCNVKWFEERTFMDSESLFHISFRPNTGEDSISDCIKRYTNRDLKKCTKCGEEMAHETRVFHEPPKYLCLGVYRYQEPIAQNVPLKVSREISVNMFVNLQVEVPTRSKIEDKPDILGNTRFQFRAGIDFRGRDQQGHYTSVVFNHPDHRLYHCNDAVEPLPIGLDSIHKRMGGASLLVYERMDFPQ